VRGDASRFLKGSSSPFVTRFKRVTNRRLTRLTLKLLLELPGRESGTRGKCRGGRRASAVVSETFERRVSYRNWSGMLAGIRLPRPGRAKLNGIPIFVAARVLFSRYFCRSSTSATFDGTPRPRKDSSLLRAIRDIDPFSRRIPFPSSHRADRHASE